MKKLFLITFTITFFLSCEKNEGIGGTSMISGKKEVLIHLQINLTQQLFITFKMKMFT